MKFKGKVDLWIWIVMWAGEAMVLAACFGGGGAVIIGMISALIYNIIFLPIVFRNYVEVTDDKLTIVFGFGRTSIELYEILSVYRTKNPISSSAASLDRLVIQAKNTQAMCAVKERDKFLAYLKEKNPQIQIPEDGKRVQGSKAGRYSMIFTIAVMLIVGVILFTGNIKTEFQEESFVIKATYWYSKEIAYEDIEHMEYREEKIGGTRIGGFGSFRLLLGDFHNQELGNYTRYTYADCDAGIILLVKGREVVLSGKDVAETEKIYEELRTYCNED